MSGYRAFTTNDDDLVCRIEYYPTPQRWRDNIDSTNPITDEKNWSAEIKYMNPTNDDVSDEIKKIPNNTGGVYMFYIKGISLPFVEKYIVYIGRALYTDDQNIRKRAKEYLKPDRELIKHLFSHWKEYLYYRYYSDVNNEQIKANEAMLIRAILPPFNEDIPNKIEVKTPIKAF